MYKLIDRSSNYGSDRRVIVKMDEATMGTLVDLIGSLSKNNMLNAGMNQNQIDLILAFYSEASKDNWYVTGLGKGVCEKCGK